MADHTPAPKPFHLSRGRVVQLCSACGCKPPEHQYFCSAVQDYTRADVLRAMSAIDAERRRIDDEQRRLEQLGLHGAAQELNRKLFLVRDRFWEWSWWLGLDYWSSTRAQRDAVMAEVLLVGTTTLPPWRRRRGRAA